MATHDMSLVSKLKKRIIALDHGKIVSDTGPKKTKTLEKKVGRT